MPPKHEWDWNKHTSDYVFKNANPIKKFEQSDPVYKMRTPYDQTEPSNGAINYQLLTNNLDSDVQKWLFNWYTDPATQKIVKEQNNNPYHLQQFTYEDQSGNIKKKQLTPENQVPFYTMEALSVPIYKASVNNGNKLGYYSMPSMPWMNKGYVVLNPLIQEFGENQNEVLMHELNHSIQSYLLPNMMNRQSNKNYDTSPEEIHSGLINFRRGFGLHPSKRDYSREEAGQMYDSLIEEMTKPNANMPQDVMRLFMYLNQQQDPYSELQELLNKWAKTDVNDQRPTFTNNTMFVKHGSKLNK